MSDWMSRLKNGGGSLFLLLGLAAGILLLVLGGKEPEEKKGEEEAQPAKEMEQTLDYMAELERRVAELLGYMDGIDQVRVVITPENAGETVYAQNGSYDGGFLTDREYVITDVDGDGKPIRVRLVFPALRGIAVVCRGGSNPINQEKIVSLLSALFGLPANRVYVTG